MKNSLHGFTSSAYSNFEHPTVNARNALFLNGIHLEQEASANDMTPTLPSNIVLKIVKFKLISGGMNITLEEYGADNGSLAIVCSFRVLSNHMQHISTDCTFALTKAHRFNVVSVEVMTVRTSLLKCCSCFLSTNSA